MAQFLSAHDSYTFAKNINGTRKLKTFSRLDNTKLGALDNRITTEKKQALENFINAVSPVIAGTDVPIQDEPVDGEIYKYRVTRTIPVGYDDD